MRQLLREHLRRCTADGAGGVRYAGANTRDPVQASCIGESGEDNGAGASDGDGEDGDEGENTGGSEQVAHNTMVDLGHPACAALAAALDGNARAALAAGAATAALLIGVADRADTGTDLACATALCAVGALHSHLRALGRAAGRFMIEAAEVVGDHEGEIEGEAALPSEASKASAEAVSAILREQGITTLTALLNRKVQICYASHTIHAADTARCSCPRPTPPTPVPPLHRMFPPILVLPNFCCSHWRALLLRPSQL